MGILLFKKCFAQAIRDGRKVTTVRRWRRARLRAGQRVYSPGVGYMSVASVEAVELETLTAADAQADGFETLADMRRTLLSMYPRIHGDGKRWFRVRFAYSGG